MKKLLPFLVLSILFVSTPPVFATGIKAEASITSVIVYPDRALVTRATELELAEGEHIVIFENLPANIDTDSLRTKGRGDARVRIYSIESKKVVLEHPREEQIAQLEAEMQDVRDQIDATKTHVGDLNTESKLVKSIGVYSGGQLSKEFITRQPKADEWDAMVGFQRENLARLSKEIQKEKIHGRQLERKLDTLRRKFQELQGQSARASQEVTVALSALSPGRFKLSLSCIVFGAQWFPTYDMRAKLKKEQVELTYIGHVRQNTGEDWTNIELSLSTARPAVGAKMPEISPWFLRPRRPEQRVDRFLMEAESLDEEAMMAPMKRKSRAARMPAEVAVAKISRRATSMQFKVPRRMDVPSDNAHHRATILSKNLPAEFAYAATPRLSPYAYLTAKLSNTTNVPWLPGKVSVFVGGDFIGTSHIKPVAPSEKIDIDLGIDEGIKVKREELARKEDEPGIFGKKKEIMFKDKISVENHKSKSIELLLIDHIPISQHDDIEVSDLEFSKKPTEQEEDKGIIKWKLPLDPGMKTEITIEFTITHPLEMVVGGL